MLPMTIIRQETLFGIQWTTWDGTYPPLRSNYFRDRFG